MGVFYANLSFCQVKSCFYYAPGISVGYTIGAGINYGVELDLGFFSTESTTIPIKSGITLSKYWTHIKKDVHRHRAISVMIESPYFDFKIGYASVKNPWGYGGNRVSCTKGGLYLDLSVTYKLYEFPWFGYKMFIFDKQLWSWYDKNYKSVYFKYKYDISQKSELRNY